MSILTERMTTSDLDISAEQAIDSIISLIPSDNEMTGDETSDSDSSHHSMASPACMGNLYSSILPLAPITMHPTAINRVILTFKTSLDMFAQFLNVNLECKNLVEFWLSCETLSKTKKEDYRKNAKAMYYRFIRGNAMQKVTLSKQSIEGIKNAFNHSSNLRSAMETAQNDAFNILQIEAFPQFKSTLYFQNLLKDPFFISLCSVPPPPPSSVCSSCFSTQSSVCTKHSNDSSVSPESERSVHTQDLSREDLQPNSTNYSRTKRHTEITNYKLFANQLINEIEKVAENRLKLTKEVKECLRNEGNSEENINNSDWTTHPGTMKYIELTRDPEESNTDIYDVIASTSQSGDTQFPIQNTLEFQTAKYDQTFDQFMINQAPSQISSVAKELKSSASDPMSNNITPYDNVQINRFFQGLEAQENRTGRVKNACDAALQLLQNAHSNMEVDSTINWAERHSQRKRRHSYHRSGSHLSLLSDTTSINSDSVASLPLRNSSRPCYYPNRHASDITDSQHIHHYATLPRKSPQQQQQQELQVFYRVGENSEINLFTRVQHLSRAPFVLRDFIHKVFKRKGNFRFYFKSWSVDLNEFVWEEIIHENSPVPLYNGNIMALVVPHPST